MSITTRILPAVAAAVFLVSAGTAQDNPPPPQVRAHVAAVPPKIDGVLDDDCWQTCDKLTGFKENTHCGDAAEQTVVRICCDGDSLYFAFECMDTQPSLIRASQTQRNYDILSDDYVGVMIDALHTHRQHYHFDVNALGTQDEEIPTGAAANITWRGDWTAAAKTCETGWTAEIAVPFAMLRYPSNADSFGIAFRRYIPRLDERSTWPELGPSRDVTRWADLVELTLPAQRSRPVFMPYTVASTQAGGDDTDFGFDLKQELPNNTTRMLTYNPDFTDVQDAVASVGFTYTERFLPERRPFFIEGSAQFPDSAAFYSRRIGDISWGVKQFGKVGRHGFALMDALKHGEANHFATTYSYDMGDDAGFSTFFTGSSVRQGFKEDPAEPDSSLCISPGAYKSWRSASGTTSVSFRQYRSINSGGMPDGNRLYAGLSKAAAAGKLGYSLSYGSTDSDYYVRDAYVPLTGVRGFSGGLNYRDRFTSGAFTDWNCYLNANRRRQQGGGLHDESVSGGISAETRNEWLYGLSFSKGTWLAEADESYVFQTAWLTRHLYGGGSFGYLVGKRAGEDYTQYWLDQSLRVTPKLILSLGYEASKLQGPAPEHNSQFTVLGNYEITPERSLGVWAVGRGSDLNLCCTYRQTVRSGADIYLIYGYPNTETTENRIALKIVRPVAW